MVEITPEVQAQLDEQKKNCIFCKIINGEMESKIVYEDELIMAVLDVNPCTSGHILILPKEHYPIMPYIPAETFKHMFGMVSKIGKAVKKSLAATAFNVFVANGGAAGQQSPHFLIHLFPREDGDNNWKYHFSESKDIPEEEAKKTTEMMATNIPIMMRNHFGRNPASWHVDGNVGEMPAHLQVVKSGNEVVYEDEKSLVVVPQNKQANGHLVIYSKEEKEHFEELDLESSSHLFYVASFCGTAVFEGLQAHGSNIILKSGNSQDNDSGLIEMHILPRYGEDGIDVIPTPLTEKPDLDAVHDKLKDELFIVAHEATQPKQEKKVEQKAVAQPKPTIDLDPSHPLYEVAKAIQELK